MVTAALLGIPEALLRSEAFLLGHLRTILVRRLTEEHANLGLRFGHGTLLICLEDAGPLAQRALAEMLDRDPSDLVKHLDILEQQGFIERRADDGDRRRNLLFVTDAGRAMRLAYDRMITSAEDDLFGVLTADDRTQLVRLLRTLIESSGLSPRPGNAASTME